MSTIVSENQDTEIGELFESVSAIATQFRALIDSGNWNYKLIPSNTLPYINHFAIDRETPSPIESNRSGRHRSRSEGPPEDLYPSSWAIDKTAVRTSVKSFQDEVRALYKLDPGKFRGVRGLAPTTATPTAESSKSAEENPDPDLTAPSFPTLKQKDRSQSRHLEASRTGSRTRQHRRTGSGLSHIAENGMVGNEANGPEDQAQWEARTAQLITDAIAKSMTAMGNVAAAAAAAAAAAQPAPAQAKQPLQAEVIGYFDPDAEDVNGTGLSSLGKTTVYSDVYAFTDRLAQMAQSRSEEAVIEAFPACLKNRAQLWLSHKTTEEKAEVFKHNVYGISTILIKKFKKQASQAMLDIKKSKLTLGKVTNGNDIRIFVDQVVRDVRATENNSVFNQLMTVWSALDFEIQVLVDQPKPEDTREKWMEMLDRQIPLIKQRAAREVKRIADTGRFNLPYRQRSDIRTGRDGNRGSTSYGYGGASNPNQGYRNNRSYQNSYTNRQGQNQNTQSQNTQNQKRQGQSGDSNNQKTGQQTRSGNNRSGYGNNIQGKANFGDAEDPDNRNENPFDPLSIDPLDDSPYFGDANQNYDGDSENNAGYGSDHSSFCGHFSVCEEAIVTKVHCKWCKTKFLSNNKMHNHLRDDKCTRKSPSPPQTDIPGAHPAQPEPETPAKKKLMIKSKADNIKDIGTGYGFQSWHYATCKVKLTAEGKQDLACVDSGCGISLAQRDWILTLDPTLEVRKRATPIPVKGVGNNRHITEEYVIANIYFEGKHNDDNACGIVQRELHLVEKLGANMLIGTDILGPEDMDIIISSRTLEIGSCNIKVPIEIRGRGRPIRQIVKATREIVIPPRSNMPIPVHHGVTDIRDLLFEPDNSVVSLFCMATNQDLSHVTARNDTDKHIVVQRNLTLGHLTDFVFDGCHHVAPQEAPMWVEFALKPPASGKSNSSTRKQKVTTSKAAIQEPNLEKAKPELGPMPSGAEPKPKKTIRKPRVIVESSEEEFKVPESTKPHLEPMYYKPPPEELPKNGEHEFVHRTGAVLWGTDKEIQKLCDLIDEFPDSLWNDEGFVNLPKEQWMKVELKPDWVNKLSGKAKVYGAGREDREVIEQTFQKLEHQGKIVKYDGSKPVPISHPVFVVWRYFPDGTKKGRVVIDSREFNDGVIGDSYPMPQCADVLRSLRGAKRISVFDGISFFYQFRIHPDHTHYFTVSTHLGQHMFLVPIMGFKGTPAYAQRQMDRILEGIPHAKAYCDDVNVGCPTFEEHLDHLRVTFQRLVDYNIAIAGEKTFLAFPNIRLLGQRVDAFGYSSPEDKIKALVDLEFPVTLKDLEHYLGAMGVLRDKIKDFAVISAPLQKRKVELLKLSPSNKGTKRKNYSMRTALQFPTAAERNAYEEIKKRLQKPEFCVHDDPERRLWIDIDTSGKKIGGMVYHVIGDDPNTKVEDLKYPPNTKIQPIMFLSRCLTSAEQNYWPSELETAGLVWCIRKVRHLIEASKCTTVVWTDHIAIVGMTTRSNVSTTTSTSRSNLRLVRAAEYISRFDIKIKHKPGKAHIVPDALSRLRNMEDPESPTPGEGELDALMCYAMPALAFTVSTISMSDDFREKLIAGYAKESKYQKVMKVLKENQALGKNAAFLPFEIEDGLIYNYAQHGLPRRLCIPASCVKEVFENFHGKNHPGYGKMYAAIAMAYYVHGLDKLLRKYLKHCPECEVYTTKRHAPYGNLQPIITPPCPFHTVTLDFILALPVSKNGNDCAAPLTCKFSKMTTIVPGKTTWTAEEWGVAIMKKLLELCWGIPKVFISDRDAKFLSVMWKAMFSVVGTKLLYSTAYHPQTDGQSEKTNEIVEINLRFHIATLEDPADWEEELPALTFGMNTSISKATGRNPAEIIMGFTPNDTIKGISEEGPSERMNALLRLTGQDAIAMAAILNKHYYDAKHKTLFLEVGSEVYLRLHKGYTIPAIAAIGKKLSQQRVGPFKILERVGRLAYKLDLPKNWRIHPVISIAHLEPAAKGADPFGRPRPEEPGSVYVEGDTEEWQSWEVEKIIRKETNKKSNTRYLIRWKGWGPQWDEWMPEWALRENANDLVEEFEAQPKRGRPRKSRLSGS